MASITGMTAGSLLAAASSKRMSGLASGLDTDQLVESMTASTRAKIAKAEQNKTKTQWKMDAYRSISSKMIAFQNKFTSYSSASNLRGSSIFSKSIITAAGEYSKYIKANGSGNNAGSVTVAGVAQLARSTSYVSGSPVSTSTLESGELPGDTTDVSKLAGQSMTFKYNNKVFSITLDPTKDYNSMEDVVDEINLRLSKTDYNSDGKLDSQIKASYTDGKLTLDFKDDSVRKTGNSLEITGVSKGIQDTLGIKKGAKLTKTKALTGKSVTDKDIKEAYDTKNMTEILGGKKFSFTYNGKTTSITLGSAEELAKMGADGKPDLSKLDMDKVRDTLQKGMDDAFGSGRVKVAIKDNKLSFQTTLPSGAADSTSVLALTSGDTQVMKALGMTNGASNRLNQTAALGKSGFNFEKTMGEGKTAADINEYAIRIKDNISGQEYVIDKTVDGEAFDAETTMADIIRAINNSDAKVQVTYLSTTDKLSIVSTQDGASGDFSIVGSPAKQDEDGNDIDPATQFNLGEAIFGKDAINGVNEENSDYTVTKGQDAIILVDFDGEGGEEPVQISRSSNTFDLNGMTVTVSGTFNTKPKEGAPGEFEVEDVNEKVTFEAKADVDKLTAAVKEMVDAYNEIIEVANKLVSEKPNRKFAPLTAEQKAEMSDDDIKNWNEKAQAGMLFNNIDLRNFTQEIRFLFGSDSASIAAWEKMGIKASSGYSDNGKLTFDEAAFRAAAESDLQGVQDMFTAMEVSHTDEDGKKVVTQRGGVMNNLKTIFDKYAGTEGATKGLFVQQAGAPESPLSMLDNTLQKQMEEFDDLIDSLNDKLEDEIEKYYNKFASLETYINNMNTQSSWLTQQFSSGN